MSGLRRLTQGLYGRKGVEVDEIRRVERELNVIFPSDFVEFLRNYDAAEGYVAGGYIQFWPVMEMVDLNRRAGIEGNWPGLVIVATDAGGDGYGLDRPTRSFVRTPMIGLPTVLPEQIGQTLESLLAWIADRHPTTEPPPAGQPATYGLVIHEKHPIVLGGSPTDRDNKVLIPVGQCVDLVAWWNEQIRQLPGGPDSGVG